jgi:hypothetical protein
MNRMEITKKDKEIWKKLIYFNIITAYKLIFQKFYEKNRYTINEDLKNKINVINSLTSFSNFNEVIYLI